MAVRAITISSAAQTGGQDTFISSGAFGPLNWNGEMIFQNTVYAPIQGNFNPTLSNISVTSSGKVEAKGQFIPTEPTIIQYVGNDAFTVNIAATPANSGTVIRPAHWRKTACGWKCLLRTAGEMAGYHTKCNTSKSVKNPCFLWLLAMISPGKCG